MVVSILVCVLSLLMRSAVRILDALSERSRFDFDNYEASSGLRLWQAERNHLPIFFRRYPLLGLFDEATRYEEFNDLPHKPPHCNKNRAEVKKFSF